MFPLLPTHYRYLQFLPEDILFLICTHLSVVDVLSLKQVSSEQVNLVERGTDA
jgi:hypothetical protein